MLFGFYLWALLNSDIYLLVLCVKFVCPFEICSAFGVNFLKLENLY